MDSMHPDPTPAPPPSLSDIRSQVNRLEAAHKAKGLPLSGRIIHLCHHLPVEIIRIVPPSSPADGGGGGAVMGVLSPPMTPEFKPEDADPTVESVDEKWKIHGRRGHTAMISGMRSLSESHEQLVIAWTGEVLLQPTSPAPVEGESLMVYNGQFDESEQKEILDELAHFSDVEVKQENCGRLTYIPVFVPPDVSKGHYEGYCKTSEFVFRENLC